MSIVTTFPHAVALRAVLEDAGFRVGDHVAPKSPGPQGRILAPCVVIYSTASPSPTGAIDGGDTDGLLRWRLTSIDITGEGAQAHADRVAETLQGFDLQVEDRAVFRLRRSSFGGCHRDDDVAPPCFYVPDLYSLMTVPNGTGS